MPDKTTIKELLEAGVHFGHQTSHWHPRMEKFIFTKRDGIHIINLEKTAGLLDQTCEFVKNVIEEGGSLLFVGTKKQAHDAIEEEAKRCGMSYVNQRWIGGTLTNFSTIQSRIDYLVRLEDQQAKGGFSNRPKKEVLKIQEEITRLNKQMGGIKEMTRLPSVLFIVDTTKERNAIAEAKRAGLPIIAMVDTNSNPDEIDYPVPSNDDAIRAIRLVCTKMANSVIEGKSGMLMAQMEEGEGEVTEGISAEQASEPMIFTPDDQ